MKDSRYKIEKKRKNLFYATIGALMGGGIAVGTIHFVLAGAVSPYTQSSSGTSSSSSPSQFCTYTPTPEPSCGSSRTSRLLPLLDVCSRLRAAIRSSASGVAFGGSSTMGSQPTGGEPGGEMRKFLSSFGGRSKLASGTVLSEVRSMMGLGSARYTRKATSDLVRVQKSVRSYIESMHRHTYPDWPAQ